MGMNYDKIIYASYRFYSTATALSKPLCYMLLLSPIHVCKLIPANQIVLGYYISFDTQEPKVFLFRGLFNYFIQLSRSEFLLKQMHTFSTSLYHSYKEGCRVKAIHSHSLSKAGFILLCLFSSDPSQDFP
ncbi:hypothetical protein YC2023_022019 [Brassica napus]